VFESAQEYTTYNDNLENKERCGDQQEDAIITRGDHVQDSIVD
jgi:hypothetical protein